MKIIITESQIDLIINDYLNSNYYPDYGWASHEHYKKDVAKWGYYDFYVNDWAAYTYFGDKNKQYNINPYSLVFEPRTQRALDLLFGDMWVPIFVKWFEENTGLKVVEIKKSV